MFTQQHIHLLTKTYFMNIELKLLMNEIKGLLKLNSTVRHHSTHLLEFTSLFSVLQHNLYILNHEFSTVLKNESFDDVVYYFTYKWKTEPVHIWMVDICFHETSGEIYWSRRHEDDAPTCLPHKLSSFSRQPINYSTSK